MVSRDTLDGALADYVKRAAVEDRLSFLDEAKVFSVFFSFFSFVF